MQTETADTLAALEAALDNADAAVAGDATLDGDAAKAAVKLCAAAPAADRRDAKRAIDAAARRPGDAAAAAAARSAIGVIAFHADTAAREAEYDALPDAEYDVYDDDGDGDVFPLTYHAGDLY